MAGPAAAGQGSHGDPGVVDRARAGAGAGDGPASRKGGAVLQIPGTDQQDQFERLFSSWDVGWRSLLLEELRYRRPVDEVVKPPVDAQSIVLVTRGRSEMERRTDDLWRSARWHAGRIHAKVPMRPVHLRWRVTSATPFETLRLSIDSGVIARLIEETWDRDPGTVVLPDVVETGDPVLGQTMLGLRQAARDGVGDLYAEAARTFLLTHLLVRYAGLGTPSASGREDERINRVRTFLRQNLDLPLTLDLIATEAGMSPYHFLRVFRAHTGQTPFRYLTRLRVERGQDELLRGSDTVAAVAARCGFPSATHFATAFRRHTGVSPTAWRRLHDRPSR